MSGKFWRCRSLIQTWSICSAFPIQRAVFRYLDGAWYISVLFFSRMFLQFFPKDRYFEDYWWAGQQSLWTLGRKQFLGGVLGNDPNWLRNQLGRNHHVDFGWGELSGFCWGKCVERLRQVIDWRNQQKSRHDMIRLCWVKRLRLFNLNRFTNFGVPPELGYDCGIGRFRSGCLSRKCTPAGGYSCAA